MIWALNTPNPLVRCLKRIHNKHLYNFEHHLIEEITTANKDAELKSNHLAQF